MEMTENVIATDTSKPRAYVYKQIEGKMEARMIYQDEKTQHLEDGWKDTPAAWYDFKPMINKETGEVPRELLDLTMETIDGVVDAANGALNLELMEGKELNAYAKKHFGMEFHHALGDKKKRQRIQDELNKSASKEISGK